MKKLLIVLGIMLLGGVFTSLTLSARSISITVAGPFEDVVAALKQGDVSGLSRYLDNTVEINISGKSSSYSKAQAEIILKDFFSKYPPKSFELVHQGGDNSRFGIGNMSTGNGNFRVSFFLQKKGGTMVLNELRFENK
jgi:amino acid transporter